MCQKPPYVLLTIDFCWAQNQPTPTWQEHENKTPQTSKKNKMPGPANIVFGGQITHGGSGFEQSTADSNLAVKCLGLISDRL